ncbi:MAG: hypothetical protein IH582_19525 [Afipia sp.]|nr:hypothetical protein [Afipia sp.]
MDVARYAETELTRFSNARVSDNERRKLRAVLYRPLLGLPKDERSRVMDMVFAILLDGEDDDVRGKSETPPRQSVGFWSARLKTGR